MKRNGLVCSLALALSLLGISTLGNQHVQASEVKSKRMSIYDSLTQTFTQRKGGINDNLLNSKLGLFIKKKIIEDGELKDFFEWAEYIEQDKKFTSYYEGLGTAIFRTQMLDALNSVCIEKVREGIEKEKYRKLNNLLKKIDKASKNVSGELEKTAKIYKVLSEELPERLETNGLQSITKVLERKGGDCNDLAPTYKVVFEHYGIDCKMVYGTVNEGHVWLRINLGGYTFDLDPTWYSEFVPLEPRI